MIGKKGIIALVLAAIVLIGAYLAVTLLWAEEDTSKPQQNSSIEVFVTSAENITAMDVTVDGENFVFVRSGESWVLSGKEDVALKQSEVNYLCGELASIYAKQKMDTEGKTLSSYGLDNPRAIYKLTLSGKDTKTFLLGKEDPVTGLFFFKEESSPDVYTIYPNKGEYIYKDSSYYKDTNILKVDTSNLSYISLTSSGSVLELTLGEKDGTPQWYMKRPMSREADNSRVNEKILSALSYVSVSEFVEEGSDKYASSGVASPKATLIIADKEGRRQTIYVGNSEDANRYVQINGKVYLINGTSLSFLGIEPFVYINKYICLENIDDISKVEVTGKGKTYTATIEGGKDNYTYRLNGAEVMDTTFRREVYQKIIGMIADGFAENPRYTTPEYTVTFFRRDGSVNTVKYCAYDDRNYAVYNTDGRCEFIIRRKNLEEMFASIDKLATPKN